MNFQSKYSLCRTDHDGRLWLPKTADFAAFQKWNEYIPAEVI